MIRLWRNILDSFQQLASLLTESFELVLRMVKMAGQNVSKSTMTKADIVEKVYQKIGFSKKEASELVELVFDTLKDVFHQGDKVKISGFGNFVVRGKNERVGRNPQTNEQIKISARRVLTFRPSQVLKAMLNGEEYEHLIGKDEDDND